MIKKFNKHKKRKRVVRIYPQKDLPYSYNPIPNEPSPQLTHITPITQMKIERFSEFVGK